MKRTPDDSMRIMKHFNCEVNTDTQTNNSFTLNKQTKVKCINANQASNSIHLMEQS